VNVEFQTQKRRLRRAAFAASLKPRETFQFRRRRGGPHAPVITGMTTVEQHYSAKIGLSQQGQTTPLLLTWRLCFPDHENGPETAPIRATHGHNRPLVS